MEITKICPKCNREMLRLNNGSFYCAYCDSEMVFKTKSTKYVKQEPYVDDNGIWAPYEEYVREGCASDYKLVMSKEIFVEAYNKWIKGE